MASFSDISFENYSDIRLHMLGGYYLGTAAESGKAKVSGGKITMRRGHWLVQFIR